MSIFTILVGGEFIDAIGSEETTIETLESAIAAGWEDEPEVLTRSVYLISKDNGLPAATISYLAVLGQEYPDLIVNCLETGLRQRYRRMDDDERGYVPECVLEMAGEPTVPAGWSHV